jgi:hypothetical protein
MQMEVVSIIALSMGAAWASGINLYATLFMLGYMASTGNITLPPELEIVANPMVMTAAGILYCIEFFADKIPGVDSAWDSVHTFIRIPAGALLASSAIGDVTPAIQLTTALLGGTLAAGTHTTKAGTRLLINTSPEPVSNWAASISEDFIVIGGLWAALYHPVLFIVGLTVFILFMIWVLPKLWRIIQFLFCHLGSWVGFCEAPLPLANSTGKSLINSNQDADFNS